MNTPVAPWQRDELKVEWCGGAVYVEHAGSGLLLDAPRGVSDRLGARLSRIRAVVLTSGRAGSVCGLVSLLASLQPHRDHPLRVFFALGEERGAGLAEAWVRGWPDSFPVDLDGVMAEATLDEGPFEIRLRELRAGEPRWRRDDVVRTYAHAVSVRTSSGHVVWVPSCAPTTHVSRATHGADLAVIEVGVTPWPRSSHRWRMSTSDAIRLCGAEELWTPGDDGKLPAPTSAA